MEAVEHLSYSLHPTFTCRGLRRVGRAYMRSTCRCTCRMKCGPFIGSLSRDRGYWLVNGSPARRSLPGNVTRSYRSAAIAEDAAHYRDTIVATVGIGQPKSLPDVPSRSSEIATKASVFSDMLLENSDLIGHIDTRTVRLSYSNQCKLICLKRIDPLRDAMTFRHTTPQDRILNSLLRGNIKSGKFKVAVELFNRYVSDQDPKPHYTVIHKYFWCLCELKLTEDLESSLAYFTHRGFVPSAYTYNILIRGYLNRLELKNAIAVLSRMGEAYPNIITINLLLRGQLLARSTLDDITSTLTIMKQLKLTPNITTYNTLLAIFYNMDMPALADSILNTMHLMQNTTTFNTIICHHLYCNEFPKAVEVLRKMHDKKVRRTAHTYGQLYRSALLSNISNNNSPATLLDEVHKMRIADCIPLPSFVNNEALRIHRQQQGLASAKSIIREMDLRGDYLRRSSFNLLYPQTLNTLTTTRGSLWHDKTMLKHAALYNPPALWHSLEFRRIQIEPEGPFKCIWENVRASAKVGDVKSCVDQMHNLIKQRISPPLWLFARVIALSLRNNRHDLAEGLVVFAKHTKAIGLVPSLMLSLLVCTEDAEVYEITRTLVEILHGHEFRIPGAHVYRSIVTACASALYKHKLLRPDAYKLITAEFKDEDIPMLDAKALTIAFEVWYCQLDLYRIRLGLTALRKAENIVPTKRLYRVVCRGRNNRKISAVDRAMFVTAAKEIVQFYLNRAELNNRRRITND